MTIQDDLVIARKRVKDLEAEEEKEALKKLNVEERVLREIAGLFHSMMCPYNHTDGCGWGYEEDTGGDRWRLSSHAEWLRKTEVAFCKKGSNRHMTEAKDDAIKFVNLLKSVKAEYPSFFFMLRDIRYGC
jgi:hypothetical protein